MKFYFKEAAHRICNYAKEHPLNVAGFFWTGGSVVLACALGFQAVGLGGTGHESIGGGISTIGEINAMFLGKRWKHSYHFATLAFLTGLTIKDAPNFPNDPFNAALIGVIWLTNLPTAFNFGIAEKAKARLELFRRAGHSFASKTKSFAKEKTLWCLANPRRTALAVTAFYSALGLTLAIKNKQYNLIPVFVFWLIGNRFAIYSEKRTSAPQRSANLPKHSL